MGWYWVVFGIFLLPFNLQAQAVKADFIIPAGACLQENFVVTNSSLNANHYEWDLCQGDLSLVPTASIAANFVGSSVPTGIDVVYDGANWYGFVVSRDNNSILRLSLGSSLGSPGSTVNLGNPSSLLNGPTDIKIVTTAGKWYGFIYNGGANTICRLDFGVALTNVPTAAVIDNTTTSTVNQGLDVVNDGVNWYVVYTFNSKVGVLRLTTIESVPTLTDKLLTPDLGGNPQLGDIKLLQSAGSFYAYTVSYSSTKLYKLSFGSNLFSLPGEEDISIGLSPSFSYYGLDGGYDAGKFYLFLATLNGNTVRVDLGADLSQGNQGVQNLGNLSVFSNIVKNRLIKDGSTWYNMAVDFATGNLFKASFPAPLCQATPGLQTSQDINVSFNGGDAGYISLRSFNGGEFDEVHKSVTISSLAAPSIDFLNQQICLQSPIQFNYISDQTITSQSWDFGDSQTSSLPSPEHTYGAIGTYEVKVVINSSNGCKNLKERTLKIYNQPTSSFTLPTGLICTNNQFTFTNNTIDNFDGNLAYQWYVDNTPLATTRDFNYAFSTIGNKEVKLKTSIPGCSSEQTQTVINVLSGPAVDFTIAGKCENENIVFTNASTGSITGYNWDFGNGQTSTILNPNQNYSKGNYAVSLQATSVNGCVNSSTKNLTIYSAPQPDFSIGLPPFSCAGSASQFTDATPAPTDSNIATWNWGFGDAANGSSSVKNPTYTYAAANTYTVSLAVATNFGCTNIIQKMVTISPSPVAGFSNVPACVNQATQFTDASSGSIKSRLWQIQGNTFSTANPQYTFPASGTFPVVLTVTANNNCVSQAAKNVVVPAVPPLDFSVQAPCANSSTVFTELTTSADPTISNAWSFGSQGTGNGNPAQFSFSSVGTYVVRLNSTRQSGCVYSISKNVSIVTAPVADFVPSIDAGAAPLPVVFANNSTGANSYLWRFGNPGNTTSVLVAPTFVFSELGVYNVELSASNVAGCTNRISKTISVVVPSVDVEMTDFFFVEDPKTGSLQPVVKLWNRSNITLTDPTILLDVAGGSGISQQITGTIKPNQEISEMLNLKLVPKTNQYVCAEVVVNGDPDTFLNRRCLSLSGEEVLFAPFPNPAREQLNMDWISIDGSPVTFQILTSAGAVSFQQTISSINPGLNRLLINTSTLPSGLYFIRFRDNKTDRTFSFAVIGN